MMMTAWSLALQNIMAMPLMAHSQTPAASYSSSRLRSNGIVLDYLRTVDTEQTTNQIATATGINHKTVSAALRHLREARQITNRRVVRAVGKQPKVSIDVWRLA